MNGGRPRILPVGDRGLVIEFPSDVSPETTARVLGADARLAALPGVVETVPTFRSVLVVYDPLTVRVDALAEQAEAAARTAPPASLDAGDLVEVPAVYGGPGGPDLDAVAEACGLSAAEVVRRHAEPTYLVYMLGFAPGYPYLGLLPPELRLPRRASPRPRVPAGSVAIADLFAGIYPQETPGGWHLLGRTPLRLFDPDHPSPFRLRPGDRVRFVPVSGGSAPPGSPVASAAQPGPPGAGPTPRRPVLQVVEAGLLTTVQDLGRSGWRRFGVPSSGALDGEALRAANAAVGNPQGAAALELTFPGPALRVLAAVTLAVAGADFDARVGGAAVDPESPIPARPGDLVTFNAPRRGQWAYLAVGGGIDVRAVFGSRATYARGGLGGQAGRPLRAGDVLGRGENGSGLRRLTRTRTAATPSGPVRVIMGPQADRFTAAAQSAFLGRAYEVTTQRDRSGMRLRGPLLGHLGGAEILSDGLLPGAVQVPGEGQPIVILADGPTTGGYAKIATVIGADLDRLAQMAPGQAIRVQATSVDAAHEAWRSRLAAWRESGIDLSGG